MKINEKGQCPICLIKPLTYKRQGQLFCHRCDRSFDINTGLFVANVHWVSPNEKSRLSKMAELAMKTGIPRPCDTHEDGLHRFIQADEWGQTCVCGETK